MFVCLFVCFESCLLEFLFHVNAWPYWKQYLITAAQFHHIYCLSQFLHLDISYIGSSLSFSTARIHEQHLSWNPFISTTSGHHLLFTSFGDRVTLFLSSAIIRTESEIRYFTVTRNGDVRRTTSLQRYKMLLKFNITSQFSLIGVGINLTQFRIKL